MDIVLLCGVSGVGKSTIAKELCKISDKYNLICSYTDRPQRDKDDTDHIFVSAGYMDLLFEKGDVAAKTKIDKYKYCSLVSQFDENKVNVYICDVYGINDIIDTFPTSNIMSVLISRKVNSEIECMRTRRDVCVPSRDDVDFIINNNTKIESAAGTLNALVNFDLFKHPSHKIKTLQEKIDYINSQYKFLDDIKYSLMLQMWNQYYSSYVDVCKYVEQKVNDDFDFEIIIEPDKEPDFFDYLEFNIFGGHKKDLDWIEIYNLTESLSRYAYQYCQDHDLKDLSFHFSVGEYLIEEEYYE